MSRPAGQIQTLHIGTMIRWFETAVQSAMARDPIDCSVQNSVTLVNILGCQMPLRFDARFQVLQPRGSCQLVEDYLPVLRIHRTPIVPLPQIRSVNKNVKRFSAGRRDTGLRSCRRTKVSGRIGRKPAFVVDGMKLLTRITRENEIVMLQLPVSPVKAKVNHHA